MDPCTLNQHGASVRAQQRCPVCERERGSQRERGREGEREGEREREREIERKREREREGSMRLRVCEGLQARGVDLSNDTLAAECCISVQQHRHHLPPAFMVQGFLRRGFVDRGWLFGTKRSRFSVGLRFRVGYLGFMAHSSGVRV